MDYRAVFFASHPELQGRVVVHHRIEQQIVKLFPGRFTEAEINSLANLRGVPNDANAFLHLSMMRTAWNEFYKSNPSATRKQIVEMANKIDEAFGQMFIPPR
jgi:hypothetical protein